MRDGLDNELRLCGLAKVGRRPDPGNRGLCLRCINEAVALEVGQARADVAYRPVEAVLRLKTRLAFLLATA